MDDQNRVDMMQNMVGYGSHLHALGPVAFVVLRASAWGPATSIASAEGICIVADWCGKWEKNTLLLLFNVWAAAQGAARRVSINLSTMKFTKPIYGKIGRAHV